MTLADLWPAQVRNLTTPGPMNIEMLAVYWSLCIGQTLTPQDASDLLNELLANRRICGKPEITYNDIVRSTTPAWKSNLA